MTVTAELVEQATKFVHEISETLNRTVTDGIKLNVVFNEHNANCVVGYQLSLGQVPGVPIPLRVGRAKPRTYLGVDYRLQLDPEGIYLSVAGSSMVVSVDAAGEQPLFRYDFVRRQKDHSRAHLHVIGDFDHTPPAGVRSLPKLHLPLGHHRFRPCLEDVVEFLITANLAEGRKGWEDALGEGRARWHELQLKAAVRRDPDIALAQLRDDGRLR